MRNALFAATLACLSCIASARAEPPPIDAFLEQSRLGGASLSPDGRRVAGILQFEHRFDLVVYDWRTRQSRVLAQAHLATQETLLWVRWTSSDRLVYGGHVRKAHQRYLHAVPRVFSIPADGGTSVAMFGPSIEGYLETPISPVRLVSMLENDPAHILLSAPGRNGPALWRVDVRNGAPFHVEDGADNTMDWMIDAEGRAILRMDAIGDMGVRYLRRAPGASAWSEALEVWGGASINLPDYEFLAAAPEPGKVWALARLEGREFADLYLYDVGAGAFGEPAAAVPDADADTPWIHPRTRAILATCSQGRIPSCGAVDPVFERHLAAMSAYFGEGVSLDLLDLSEDETVWLLLASSPTLAPAYVIYDSAARRLTPIAAASGGLDAEVLSPTRIHEYAARDGAPLMGYLTVPRDAPEAGAPLVVLPHGGPESRDYYIYDPLVQFLASRGYLVFQPQFRGSAGFGRSFQLAGRGQWGQLMQDDVTDGVRSLIAAGRVDPQRICIIGASYGGYVALAGAAFTPDLYRCAVSIAGVSDLPEFLRLIGSTYGRGSRTFDYWRRSIGDPRADRETLARVSPSRHAAQIQAPVLLVHGDMDPIAPYEQSTLMAQALRRAGKNVELITVAEGGHSSASWISQNRRRLYARLELFLAQHIGSPPRS